MTNPRTNKFRGLIPVHVLIYANITTYVYCMAYAKTIRDLISIVSTDSGLQISNSYTMGCPPVRGDNPRALASRLSYVHADKHGVTILYHLHQCRHCTSRDISC